MRKLGGELIKTPRIFNILPQTRRLFCGDANAAIFTILPALVLEVRPPSDGALSIGRRDFPAFADEGAALDRVELGEFRKNGFAG